MNVYAIPNIIGSLCFLTLAIFVYMKNKKSKVNATFALMCITGFIWQFMYALAYLSPDKETAFIMFKIGYIGVIFIPATVYHFIILFLNLKNQQKIIIAGYIIALIFSFFCITTRYFMDGLYKYFWGYYPKVSFLHPLYLLFLVTIVWRGIIYLYLETRKKDFRSIGKYNQIKYVILAIFVWFLGAEDFIQNYGVEIYPFGFIFVLGFFGLLAYAIVRHKLMEIEVFIKKTLVFAGLFASTFAILVLPTLVIQEFIVGKMNLGGRITGLGIGAALIILILRPLENFLINITDKYLFQKKYDYKQLLKTFTGEVLTVLDINRLTKLTAYKLADIIKLVSCGVLLFDEEKEGFTLAASYGIKEKNTFLGKENTLATFMERTRAYLSIEHQGEDSPLPEKIIRDMNILKVELAIPLVLHSKMIGILTLGKKKSDEGYTQDDIDILLPLARTLAIAIGNAELFDELSKTQAEAAQREKMAVIGTLSAGINHEICNPLGIVRGQCEAFMLNLKEGLYKDKTEKELLEKAIDIMKKSIKEVDRATAVTKRLSTFAKPIKEIKVDEIKIKDEINEVMALVGHELRLEKIEVIQEIPDDLPGIIADRKQIEEIFFNLIRNAGQAIGEEGRITIRAKFNGNNKVLIEIEDTGHGIPENKIEQIFNPFYTTKEPGKGTGLGLFIVRQVVEKNKGKISVKSKIGVGTTFTLEFLAATKVEV